ncbi:MAG: hypothetical protein A3K76_01915 [Euryarchaeota archaeon RBG_13_57_23]|nr:MAG: hypothetical protein A3K76_01915 [Euryarchaeota archaeon RBG_13_57_23]
MDTIVPSMPEESVVFVSSMRCPSCGLVSSGYLQAMGDGRGVAICPSCGTTITQHLPSHYVTQIPPSDFNSPVHPHVHTSHYPGLYTKPRHAPRLDFADLLRVAYSPKSAFTNLYLSTDLHRALAIVLVFSILSSFVSILVTADMGELLGYGTGDALTLAFQGFVSWIVSLLAFLIFGLTSALVAKGVFGGRGERSATITLLGYSYPAYVLLSIVVILVFNLGFKGLDFGMIDQWTENQLNQASVAGIVLLVVAFIGLAWLLWISSSAVSVANDVSKGEGALSVILAAIAAGVVYILVGMVMRLPIGLSF